MKKLIKFFLATLTYMIKFEPLIIKNNHKHNTFELIITCFAEHNQKTTNTNDRCALTV